MGSFSVEEDISAGVDRVWAKFSDFAAIGEWGPNIEKCEIEGEGIGQLRKLSMGVVTIVERLEAFDDAGKTLSYSIPEGPIPVEDDARFVR